MSVTRTNTDGKSLTQDVRDYIQSICDKERSLGMNVAVNRYEENDNFFMSLFSDESKLKFVMNMMAEVIYNDLNSR